MSTFDPDAFLNTEYQEAAATKLEPVPEGEYQAQIDNVTAKQITTKEGDERIVMEIIWNILDDDVKAQLGMDKVTVKQGLFLDLSEEGSIDMSKGKNVRLGRLREALGQNKDGKPWSPGKMIGESAFVQVTQRPDKADPEVIYNDIGKVAAA